MLLFPQLAFAFKKELTLEDVLNLREPSDDLACNSDGLLAQDIFLQEFLKHPEEKFLEVFAFGWEKCHHLVEVGGEEYLVAFGVVEEVDVDVTERVDAVVRGCQGQYARQVEGHQVQNLLVLGLRQLDERAPEAEAVDLIPEDHMLQLLVGLSHQFYCHKGHPVAL